MITVAASNEPLPTPTLTDLVELGVEGLIGWAQTSTGLFHTTEVKNRRWLRRGAAAARPHGRARLRRHAPGA